MEVKITQPLLPLRDIVVFPSMVIPLFVGREPEPHVLLQRAMRPAPLRREPRRVVRRQITGQGPLGPVVPRPHVPGGLLVHPEAPLTGLAEDGHLAGVDGLVEKLGDGRRDAGARV